MDLTPASKRLRKPNWTLEEIEILLEELVVAGEMLFSATSPENTCKMKFSVWQKIANAISSVGVTQRTVEECKSKWKLLKKEVLEGGGETKKEAGERMRDKYVLFEQMVKVVIDKKASALNNIEGCGPETYMENTNQSMELMDQNNTNHMGTNGPSASYADSSYSGPVPRLMVEEGPNHTYTLPEFHMRYPTDPSAISTARPKAPKARFPLRRPRPSNSTDPRTGKTNTPKPEDDESESALFKDYLRSEIQKNEAICEQMKLAMEEREERRTREREESRVKLELYRNLNRKLLGVDLMQENGIKVELTDHVGGHGAFAGEETYV